jgi:membrane protein
VPLFAGPQGEDRARGDQEERGAEVMTASGTPPDRASKEARRSPVGTRSVSALARVDAWQRRHRSAAFAVAVIKKFGDDRASSLAALIAYYAFLSLFPLLLAFVSVLGFVLEDDPGLQADIVDSALARIPVIGAQLGDDVQPLTGSSVALAIGLVGALWAGLGVTLALGRAFDEIWDVPRLEQRGPLARRARGALVLVILACGLMAATVGGGVAIAVRIGPAAERIAAVGASLLVNATVLLAAFWLLTARPRRAPDLLPGVLLAAVGLLALQAIGSWYVERAIDGASDTYGAFALVIGLLSWFWLGSHLLLVAAELNVVRVRRLWPRSLTGELEPADRLAMQRYAAAVRQDRRQLVTVTFSDERGES